jgi:hypothetical protein
MPFVHKPLTREQLLTRVDQKKQIIDPFIRPEFQIFRPKVGRNMIRIMEATWPNPNGFAYTLFVHYGVGSDNSSYLCLAKHLREPCPVCEEVKALDSEGDSEAGKQIYARKTSAMWVLDRADMEKGLQVYTCGYTIEQDLCEVCIDPKTGIPIDIIDPVNGFDVTFTRGDQKPFPKTGGWVIDRDPSPIDDDPDWQKYEHIYGVLHGRAAAAALKEPKPETVGRSAPRRLPPPVDEVEEGEDIDELPDSERVSRTRAVPEEPRQTRRPPPPTADPEPEQQSQTQVARRRPPADEEPASSNGEDTSNQGRAQLQALRERSERRQLPPDDIVQITRRRPPPPQ